MRAIRLYYDFDSKEIIAKLMLLPAHETPHLLLIDDIREKTREMGLDRRELAPMGHTTYRGGNTARQGDSVVKPAQARNKADDWPTLVIEAGVSESLAQLRIDAGWWLTNSKGDVRIVIIIAIHRQAEKFIIEKWQLISPDITRTHSQSNGEFRTPWSTTSITISRTTSSNSLVASDDLVIEFSELLLRPPVPPESDTVLTKNDLEDWANFTLPVLR